MNKVLRENLTIAWRSIQGQLLRTILTILIIAFGIMSLVGMLTAIDVLKQSINENFSFLGANTFAIKNRGMKIQFGRGGQRPKKHQEISYDQALRFKEAYEFPAVISISANATSTGVLKYGSKKTHPNIPVVGADEDYLIAGGFEIADGRNFTTDEVHSGAPVVIIGSEIKSNFFGNNPAEGESIWIGSKRYTIIGTLQEKGAGLGMGNDRIAIISINNLRTNYKKANTSFSITVKCESAHMMDNAVGEATGLFRIIRKDPLGKEESFDIEKSDSLINELLGMTQYISMGSIVIALITLLGALIGLLNIMLVSVTERTREIGVRKAIGATRSSIAYQFLIEAVLICQLGGFLGVLLGILIGNSMTAIIGGSFVVPWNWMIVSVIVCFVVGVASGLYPALKASRLDPVESLRYE
ncbi:MAG: ABC transporter permease [Candidatus Competibacteraceae bacterium]|nr:ABC transporter permease [Candidatus Competibacteraceae bacterium]